MDRRSATAGDPLNSKQAGEQRRAVPPGERRKTQARRDLEFQAYREISSTAQSDGIFAMDACQIDDLPATALLDLIASHRVTAALYVAARLGIAELFAQGVNRPNELAQRTGTHGPSLLRLLNALVTIGICKKVGIQEYELTAIGEYLAGDTEQSLKSWALYEGEMLWRSWGGGWPTRFELERIWLN